MPEPVDCYIGIGSNLGNRREHIRCALRKVGALSKTSVVRVSSIRSSKPQGGAPGQGDFLNAVIAIRTELSPQSLLLGLKEIEKSLGRRKTKQYDPRVIDLDILLYGNKFVDTVKLKIPHPRMYERDFVLKPFMELV